MYIFVSNLQEWNSNKRDFCDRSELNIECGNK
jgi:hypothetical protein